MNDKTRTTENQDRKEQWSKESTKALKGAIVKQVRWMTNKEMDEYDWLDSAPVIEFMNGLTVIASRDEVGNSAGALLLNLPDLSVLPRI